MKKLYNKQTPLILELNESEDQTAQKLLETDYFYKNRLNNRPQKDMHKYYVKLCRSIRLIDNSNDTFWDFLSSRPKTGEKVLDSLLCRSNIYKQHKNSFNLNANLNGINIQYTKEAIRVFKIGEREVKNRSQKKIK